MRSDTSTQAGSTPRSFASAHDDNGWCLALTKVARSHKYLSFSLFLVSTHHALYSRPRSSDRPVRCDVPAYRAPFLSPVTTAPGFMAQVIFSNLTAPRGIAFDDKDNLLVVERGLGVTAFTETTQGGTSGWERTVVISDPGFTHAIEIDGSSLFVSTASEVRLYKYDSTTKTVSGSTVVVNGLPANGGTGPLTNIDLTARDPASGRSQVRGFKLSTVGSVLPQTWLSGELIAYGIRNPASFAIPAVQLSAANVWPGLYILENGASIDDVPGFSPKFVNDNPADELELVAGTASSVGKTYGFPDCTTLWNPTADPVGNPQYVGLPQGAQFSLNLIHFATTLGVDNKLTTYLPH
ncbi:soluble quino protein glucose/sorbosone dehydrogenase [Salix suchowensis]|nr:soluble quino protein glucose/sorbosone dehydrogenase [Salix suchowensis]